MEGIQLNLNHSRAAHDLLRHSVYEVKADVTILSEPYIVGDRNLVLAQNGCGGPEISSFRKECLRARRILQRARATDMQEQRHADFKAARKDPKIAIRENKREVFLKLCDDATHDAGILNR